MNEEWKEADAGPKEVNERSWQVPDKWFVVKALPDELHVVHRETGRQAIVLV